MIRTKKCPGKGYGTPAWMTTWGDMNSLLLTFFIMLIARMSTNTGKSDIALILSSFTGALGIMEGGNTLSKGQLTEAGNTIESLPSREVGNKLSRAVQEISQLFKPELKSRKVRIDETQKGYKITLSSDIFFRPGSAEIDFEEGHSTLKKIGDALKQIPENAKIEVIGHTDSSRIPKESSLAKFYPSNWELSAARSSSVVRTLVDHGVSPQRMYVEGRGEYDPLESNDTPEGRAFNRRIDIYISAIQ